MVNSSGGGDRRDDDAARLHRGREQPLLAEAPAHDDGVAPAPGRPRVVAVRGAGSRQKHRLVPLSLCTSGAPSASATSMSTTAGSWVVRRPRSPRGRRRRCSGRGRRRRPRRRRRSAPRRWPAACGRARPCPAVTGQAHGRRAHDVGEVGAAVGGDDAGQLERGRHVDADDLGVRHRAAQDGHVQQARQRDVVGPVGLAGDQLGVLLAARPRRARRRRTAEALGACRRDRRRHWSVMRASCVGCRAGTSPAAGPRRAAGGRRAPPDDVLVAGAAAEVALEAVADLVLASGCGCSLQQVDRRHDHAGGAVAALQRRAARGRPAARVRCHSPSWRRGPGSVVTSLPSAWTASTEQLFTLSPSSVDRAGAAVRGVAADRGADQAEAVAQVVDRGGDGAPRRPRRSTPSTFTEM